ncbi:MAG: hypothetical protein ACRDZ4_20895 [Egibacteraceae bacterium]
MFAGNTITREGNTPLFSFAKADRRVTCDLPTHIELAEQMLVEVAGWLPDRTFRLACDGAYASLAGRALPRTHVVSRMRRDAAIYSPPPPRTGRRGRPRKKGARLPTPTQIAAQTKVGWRRVTIDVRGKTVQRLVLSRRVLWYPVCPDRLVQLVIVRDPDGREHDDFFFTTDLDAAGEEVAGFYAGRWSIQAHLPQHQTVSGRRGPPNLESRRTGARCGVVVVAVGRRVDLVHPRPRDTTDLAGAGRSAKSQSARGRAEASVRAWACWGACRRVRCHVWRDNGRTGECQGISGHVRTDPADRGAPCWDEEGLQSQQRQSSGRGPGGPAQPLSDVGRAREAQHADRKVAQCGHDPWAGPGPDL